MELMLGQYGIYMSYIHIQTIFTKQVSVYKYSLESEVINIFHKFNIETALQQTTNNIYNWNCSTTDNEQHS